MMRGDEISFLLREALDSRKQAHQWRERHVVRPVDSTHVLIDGRRYVNFASNDYLGLTHHPRVIDAAVGAIRTSGVGVAAASLITGYTSDHFDAERALSRWKGTDDAVLLPSGYQANHAAVQAVAAVAEHRTGGGGVRFLIDKLAHASLIDAVRATGHPFRVFPHNHLAKVRRLLEEAEPEQMQAVVTESIFSMDGDAGDLAGLAQLKGEFPFLLLVDEAHGSGVYGPGGSGYAAEQGIAGAVDLTVVTLSKAIGVIGGAVCASSEWCQAVVNFGRASIYTTSVPPAIAASVKASIDVMANEPYRQARVRALALRVRESMRQKGLHVPPGDAPIVPVILGEESAALHAADRLRDRGLLVVAVRPPTVPRGTSRLRITLSCDHTDAEVDALLAAVGA